MPEDPSSLVYPLNSNQAAILLWVVERPNHGRVELHRGGLSESMFDNGVSPLEVFGLLKFTSNFLFETRGGRVVSGVIEVTDHGASPVAS